MTANTATSLAGPDTEVLGFVADMYAVQVDQLAALLADKGGRRETAVALAREVVADWKAAGYAVSDQLSPGEGWVWATRKGLDACGLRPTVIRPSSRLLRHIHAVTDVRLALERTSAYRDGGASWHPERRILARLGYPSREAHVPDGELRWPASGGSPWTGQTWAVEVELSRKTIARIAEVMHETLTRTGDHGSPAGAVAVPGHPPRYARMVYACSPFCVRAVLKARAQLGPALSARVKIYDLPASASR